MQFERWADLRIDLGQAAELDLGPSLYEGDSNPLKVGVRLYDAAGEVAVSGDPAARAVTADGQVIAPLATGKSGNTAWCIVPQGALQRGLLRVYLRAVGSADTAVMLYAHGTVRDTGDGEPLNPGQPVPNLEDMQAAAAQAVAAAAAAEDDVAGLRGVITPYHEDSMVATRAYTSGDILMVGSAIYKAKRNITSGTELTSTYVSEITLREYLSGTGTALGAYAHGEGEGSRAVGQGSHAEGYMTVVPSTSKYGHSEGMQTAILNGNAAHVEGYKSQANGVGAHAEGSETFAAGAAHSEGYKTEASATYSHAEGNETKASKSQAHAEGKGTTASGTTSHAEGENTVASSDVSHAEGYGSTASGIGSHAEGMHATASGVGAHAEGTTTAASGSYSHAEGEETIANHRNQHVFGTLNVPDPSSAIADDPGTYIEIVGNGQGATRSNARTLDWSGNEKLAGSLTLGMGTADEVTLTAAQLKQLLALLN